MPTTLRQKLQPGQTGQLGAGERTPSFLHQRTTVVFCLHDEVTSRSLSKIQEQLKEDDMECIVNQDELAMNHQEQATSPSSPPARLGLDQKTSPQTLSKENLCEGDLGLGGYELKLAQTPGQSPLS